MEHGSVIVILGSIEVLVQSSLIYERADSFMSQIGIYRTGSVAQKCCKMMNLSRLCGLQYHCHSRALFSGDKVLLKGRNCKERRYGTVELVHTAVGENEYGRTVAVSLVSLDEKPFYCLFKGCTDVIGYGDNSTFHSL